VRRSILLHLALTHNDNPVSEKESFVQVVCDQKSGNLELASDVCEGDLKVGSCYRIQGTERLIEQDDTGLSGQGSRNRHPLALPARQLSRPTLAK